MQNQRTAKFANPSCAVASIVMISATTCLMKNVASLRKAARFFFTYLTTYFRASRQAVIALW